MKITVLILVMVHGMMHFMGFAKAFAIGNIAEFGKELAKYFWRRFVYSGNRYLF